MSPYTTIPDKVVLDGLGAGDWNAVAANLRFLQEIAYTEFTANVSVTATSEAGANTIVTAPAFTAEAVPHLIEFYSPRIGVGVAALRIALFDGSTSLGLIASLDPNNAPIAGVLPRRLALTAASHTLSVRAWNSAAATSAIGAGLGGTGVTLVPGFIRIRRVPT